MDVSQETIAVSSGISESSDILDTVEELFWDAHWTLDDDEWQPEPAMTAL